MYTIYRNGEKILTKETITEALQILGHALRAQPQMAEIRTYRMYPKTDVKVAYPEMGVKVVYPKIRVSWLVVPEGPVHRSNMGGGLV